VLDSPHRSRLLFAELRSDHRAFLHAEVFDPGLARGPTARRRTARSHQDDPLRRAIRRGRGPSKEKRSEAQWHLFLILLLNTRRLAIRETGPCVELGFARLKLKPKDDGR